VTLHPLSCWQTVWDTTPVEWLTNSVWNYTRWVVDKQFVTLHPPVELLTNSLWHYTHPLSCLQTVWYYIRWVVYKQCDTLTFLSCLQTVWYWYYNLWLVDKGSTLHSETWDEWQDPPFPSPPLPPHLSSGLSLYCWIDTFNRKAALISRASNICLPLRDVKQRRECNSITWRSHCPTNTQSAKIESSSLSNTYLFVS